MTPQSRTWPARSANPAGYCCNAIRIGAGCSRAMIHRGTPRCVCSGKRGVVTGRQLLMPQAWPSARGLLPQRVECLLLRRRCRLWINIVGFATEITSTNSTVTTAFKASQLVLFLASAFFIKSISTAAASHHWYQTRHRRPASHASARQKRSFRRADAAQECDNVALLQSDCQFQRRATKSAGICITSQ